MYPDPDLAAVAVPDPSGRFSGHPAPGGRIGQGFEPWCPSARHPILFLSLLLTFQAVSTAFPFGDGSYKTARTVPPGQNPRLIQRSKSPIDA